MILILPDGSGLHPDDVRLIEAAKAVTGSDGQPIPDRVLVHFDAHGRRDTRVFPFPTHAAALAETGTLVAKWRAVSQPQPQG